MPQTVRGVVARAKGVPVTIEQIVIPDPGPGEAVVRIQACGVCHTDLHYRDGAINDDFPFLLGHEAAGVIETVLVPDPGAGEALVQVQACGVCHTDLHYREGGINDDFPFLLGHEAAGVVEAVGDGVTDVQPGDYVILNWRAVCGQCRACLRGRPWYCFDTANAAQPMTLVDGTPLSPALGIGAFAAKTLVHAGQCTKVDPQARPAGSGEGEYIMRRARSW